MRSAVGLAALAAIAALAAVASGCSRDRDPGAIADAPAPAASAPGAAANGPIVLVVVDTLRADHLPCYGYPRPTAPALCALAADGFLFERAFTPRTSTTPAIASALTGLYPHRHGLRRLYQLLPPGVPTLPEMLRERGHRTGAFVSSFVMVKEMNGFERGFDVYDDRMSHAEREHGDFERHASETVDRALEWLRAGGARAFLFVHLIEPHGPYTPPAAAIARFALDGGLPIEGIELPPYQRLPGLARTNEYVGRYDAEIATVDAELGRLLDGLRALGWYDAATILVTADHGESLGEEDQWFRHGRSVHDAEAHVPLVLKLPAGSSDAPGGAGASGAAVRGGRRVAAPVSLVDVLPTLAAAAGAVPPEPGAGDDLRAIAAGAPRRAAPVTELLLRDGLLVAAHGAACTVRWRLDDDQLTDDGRLAAGDPRRWSETAPETARYPAAAPDACAAGLRGAAAPVVADLLSFERGFAVAQRSDMAEPADRARFLAARGDPIVPLAPSEHEKLRQLGYVE